MTNVLKMLEERRKRGGKLNLYKEVMPNRERANVMHNRAVRAKLVTAAERKRHATHVARTAQRTSERAVARFLTNPSDRGYMQHTLNFANAAVVTRNEARRNYDRVVEEANDVMKKHEVYKKHYRSNVKYREGNAAQHVIAFNA
jgi:pantoate kinase